MCALRQEGRSWWRLAELIRHEPDVFTDARRFLCMPDFVFHQLGLDPAMDHSLATRTMAFDVNRLTWSEEILSLAELDRERLSRALPSGSVVGEIAASVVPESVRFICR